MAISSKHLLAIALSLAAATQISAQSYAESQQQQRHWSQEPIEWSIFQGSPLRNDTLQYHLRFLSDTHIEAQKLRNTVYSYNWPKTAIDPISSWIRAEKKTPEMLKFCQTQFDLWELLARKGMIEYNSTTTDVSWDELSDYYTDLFYRRQNALWEESDHASNTEYLDAYDALLRQELDTLTFDPTTIYDTLQYPHGVTVAVGLKGEWPQTDYASMGIGGEFEAAVLFGKNMVGMDCSFGYAKCRKDIYETDGVIDEGDAMLTGSLDMYYGRLVHQTSRLSVAPYVGLGVHFYNGGEKYYWEDDEDKHAEKNGFTFGMGVMFDLPIMRRVHIKDLYGIRCNTRSIRLKPYLSCTRYHGDMGLVPALNLSISWVWGEGSR